MKLAGMNKLARADCPQCGGLGKVRAARMHSPKALGAAVESPPPAGEDPAVGFFWTPCNACKGEGKR